MEKHDENSNDLGRQRRYRPCAVKGIDSRRLDMVESLARARQLPHHKLKDKPRMNLMLALLHRRDLLDSLQSGLQSFLDPTATILEAQVKRWRHALPTTFHPERCLPATDVPPLAFAGDAFGWPRVEGAALSGIVPAFSRLMFAAGCQLSHAPTASLRNPHAAFQLRKSRVGNIL